MKSCADFTCFSILENWWGSKWGEQGVNWFSTLKITLILNITNFVFIFIFNLHKYMRVSIIYTSLNIVNIY